jgi:hypothetical protein
MKTSRSAALAAALLATGVSAPCALLAESKNPSIPMGSLSAFPVIVQPGTHPTLTWNISYPSIIQDYVEINDPGGSEDGGSGGDGDGGGDDGGGSTGGGGVDGGGGTGGGSGSHDTYINPKTTLDVEIRVIGAGVTYANNNGTNLTFVPTEAQVSFDGGSYARCFYATNKSVKPNYVVWWKKSIQAGQKLRFGGRYYYNRSWGPYFNSQSGTKNVRILVNGDVPPTTYPLHSAPTLESFLKPYLDASGKVKIGPMDCIVFMELTHSDSQITHPGYDLQDMVMLVTFKSKNNNGHGNNVDGVDSSNPGNAPFVDSDPTVDDEKK